MAKASINTDGGKESSAAPLIDDDEKQRIRRELGRKIKSLRVEREMTLEQASSRTGLAVSTIYKIENGKVSPSYENLVRLARGYEVGLERLFGSEKEEPKTTRMTVTRAGEGRIFGGRSYEYEMLCNSLTDKKIIPMIATVERREPFASHELEQHEGEEVLLVLSGEVELRVEHYEPVILHPGDSAYYDSTIRHGVRSLSPEDARIFWACTHVEGMN